MQSENSSQVGSEKTDAPPHRTCMNRKSNTENVRIEKTPGLKWTAVYTKPRCEKVVAEHCRRHGLTCYLPLRRRAKRYQRRTVVTFIPMFPGYVFAQISAEAKTVVGRSSKAVAVLPVSAVQETRLVEELQGLQLLEQADLEAELVVQPELAPGKTITISNGPLQGLQGVVERRQQKARITVNVEMLGQSVYVDLDVGEVDAEKE